MLYWINVEKVSKGVQFLTRSKLFPLFLRGKLKVKAKTRFPIETFGNDRK